MHTLMDLCLILKEKFNSQNPQYRPSDDLHPMVGTRVKRPRFDGSIQMYVLM